MSGATTDSWASPKTRLKFNSKSQLGKSFQKPSWMTMQAFSWVETTDACTNTMMSNLINLKKLMKKIKKSKMMRT